MPVLGLGVYRIPPGDSTYQCVLGAIGMGFRNIDTAQYYLNEEDVGRAVRDSGIARKELWITTKLSAVWKSQVTYNQTFTMLRASLLKLNMGYLDLYLIHSPRDIEHRIEQWHALIDAKEMGLVRSIGVSDYTVESLSEIMAFAVPAVLQIELNPWLAHVREAEITFCKAHGIAIQAWGALAVGQKFLEPELIEISSHYTHVDPATVLIKWSLQSGYMPLTTSQNPTHLNTNIQVAIGWGTAGWELTEAEMAILKNLANRPYFSSGYDVSGDEIPG